MWNGLEDLRLDNGFIEAAGASMVTGNLKLFPERGRGGVTVISPGVFGGAKIGEAGTWKQGWGDGRFRLP